jgi:Bacterial Ig domain/Calx-beta domain
MQHKLLLHRFICHIFALLQKRKELLSIALLVASTAVTMAVDVVVPATTSGGGLSAPFGGGFSQCRLQSIYLASEIGTTGTIRSLSLNMNSIPGQVLQNCTIRLRQTSAPTFASAVWDDGFTTVFQGAVKITATGKATFPFQNPFTYSGGSNNLMVDISFKNASGVGVSAIIDWSSTVGIRSIFYRDSGGILASEASPTTWSGSSPSPFTGSFVPNITLEIGRIVYVSAMATGGNSGKSWADAYTELSTAIANNPSGTTEIWVQAGTYKPTNTDDRRLSFALREGLSVYGGFGGVEVSRFQRDPRTRPTILSGDINTADVSTDNSYHVVTTASSGGLISGFIIRDGYADGSGNDAFGGGLLMTGNATITDCVFDSNLATYGGGLSLFSSSKLTMDRCWFINNTATLFGGGMYISSNQANTISNTVFYGNAARNATSVNGGGGFIADTNTVATLTNCTFANNTAISGGGGLETFNCKPTIRNTIFWGNTNTSSGNPSQIFSTGTGPTATNCLIQGGVPSGTTDGGGLVTNDPQFLNVNDVLGTDGLYGTGDDGLTLKLTSPAISAGSATGITTLDICENRRLIGTVDMGAYERTQVIYVDRNAGGANNGSSWASAYTSLITGLANAKVAESEIWLADGTYLPSNSNNRNESFNLVEHVAIYGGFNSGETDLLQRNTGVHRAVLSGDIGVVNTVTDNSYHVVRGANGAILDAVSIVKGYANGKGTTSWSNSGAGLIDEDTSTTLINCVVADNESAHVGGGVAGVYTEGIGSDSATGTTLLRGCVVTNNKGKFGGGLFLLGASGGIVNCTFTLNESANGGGAMYADKSAPLTVSNSILYGDSLPEIFNNSVKVWISTSNVGGSQGSGSRWNASLGVDKGGNLDVDPIFIKGSNPAGADGTYATNDDGLRLLATSPCIDVGALVGGPQKDLLGNNRPTGGSPDLGAFEGKMVYADFQLATSSANESTANPGIMVRLSEASDLPVTVTYVRDSMSGGTATVGTDFSLGTLSVTFSPGETTKALNVTILNDSIEEINDTIGFSLTGATNARLDGTMLHTYTIVNDDKAGIKTTPTTMSLNESGTESSKAFVLQLDSVPANGSTITVEVVSSTPSEARLSFGGATNQSSVNVVWSAGNYGAKFVTVSAVSDNIDDGNVDLVLITKAATSSSDSFYTGKDPDDVNVTVVDNDDVGIVTAINGSKAQVEVTEANVAATDFFTVRLNSEPTGSVTVQVASSNTQDAIISPTTLTFTPSGTTAWNLPQTVTVTAIDDQVDEPGINPIPFSITLNADSSDGKYDVLSRVVNGHLTDNDAAAVLISPSAAQTPSENGGSVVYDVVLATRPSSSVTIGAGSNLISSSNTAEGAVSATTLTFSTNNGPGGWDTPQQITVTAVNDDVAAINPTYTITFPAPTSTDTRYSGLTAVTRDITNANDDAVGITFTPSTGLETSENGTTATTVIRLTSQPTANVTVRVLSDNTGEGRLKLGAGAEASFVDVILTPTKDAALTGSNTAGWNVGVPITIVGQSDVGTPTSTNDIFNLDITNRTSTDGNYSSTATVQNVVTITNIDSSTRRAVVTPTTLTINENAGEGLFTVALTKDPAVGETVTIPLSCDGSLVLIDDYINTGDTPSNSMSLSFTSANFNSPRTIRVTAVDNSIDAANATATITTGATVSSLGGASLYHNIAVADVTVTVTDNDTRGVTLNPTAGLTTTESGGQAAFFVVLNSQPATGNPTTDTVTVTLRTNDSTEGKIRAGVSGAVANTVPLTFTAANWSIPQIISVVGQDDNTADGPISYTVDVQTITATAGDYVSGVLLPTAVTISNADNDAVGVLLSKTTMALNEAGSGNADTYTIRLTSQPASDVEITFAPGNAARVDTDNVTSGEQLKVRFKPTGVSSPTVYANGLEVNWDVPLTIYVTSYDDAIADGTHKAYLTHQLTSADSSYNGLTVSAVEATITDNDSAGITTSPNTVTQNQRLTTKEDGSSDTLSIVLATQPRVSVTVLLSTDQSDEAVIVPDRLTIKPGDYNDTALHTVRIQGVNDDVADGSQPFKIKATVVSADAVYDNFAVSDVEGDNQDDDVVGVAFTATTVGSPLVTNEAGGTAIFTVRLTSEPTADVKVAINSSNTDEGTVATTQPLNLTFTAGNWRTDQIVTITGKPDNIDEALASTDYLVTLSAGGAGSAISGYEGNESYNGAAASASGTVFVTNTDIDQAGVIISPQSGLLTSEAGTSATYSVVLNSKPTDAVRVNIDAGSSPQLSAVTQLDFTTANWNVAQTVTVTAINDNIAEGTAGTPHTGTLTHTLTTTDPIYLALPSLDNVTALITDNDTAGFSITKSVDPLVTHEDPLATNATSTFRVNLSSEPTSTVRITVTSADANEVLLSLDGVRANATASVSYDIAIADWNQNTVPMITAFGVNDDIDDNNKPIAVTVAIDDSNTADVRYDDVADLVLTITNQDKDTAGVTVTESAHGVNFPLLPSDLSENEVTTEYTYTVVLTSQPTADVTITISDDGQIDADADPDTAGQQNTVIFSAAKDLARTGNTAGWNVPVTIRVIPVDDLAGETSPHSGTLTHIATGGGYTGVSTASVVVSIADNDASTPPVVTLPGANPFAYDENGHSARQIDATATVNDVDSANFNTGNITVTFTSGGVASEDVLSIRDQGTAAGQVSVVGSAVSYNPVANTGSVQVASLSGGSNGSPLLISLSSATPSNVSVESVQAILRQLTYRNSSLNPTIATRTITVTANDGDGGTSAPVTKNITITPYDDPPVLLNQNITTAVNRTITGQLSANDPEGLTLTFTKLSDPTNGTLTLNANGSYTYAPLNGDYQNDYTFTARVTDPGNNQSADATFTIRITGGAESRPLVIRSPPFETEFGALFAVIGIAPSSKAGTAPFQYQVMDLPAGITATITPLTATTTEERAQINWSVTGTPNVGDHFTFGVLITDVDGNAATYVPVTLQVVQPLGPG